MFDAHQRGAERVPISGDLHGEVMVFQPLLVREIGTKGLSVETTFPLHIDSLHEVRLALGGTSVVVKGRVVHSHVSQVSQDVAVYRTGLEFVEPSLPVLDAIAAFLERVKAGHGQA
jgi:hypothetical protein